MKLLVPFVLASCAWAQLPYATSIDPAQVAHEIPANRGSTALWQSLKKLHTRASMIMVTAHPDDEDGGMLAYESRGQGTRVALLTLNRGEGGANVMSPDYFDALGLVDWGMGVPASAKRSERPSSMAPVDKPAALSR